MKKLLKLTLAWLCITSYNGYSQNCADDYSDITQNQFVCSSYGDGNGNSNWNWEIKPTDPNFCKQWYARTSSISTKLTAMGSPFVNSPTSALDLIAQSEDYTRAKGWELLQRDFGCSHVTAYPYFILYNKFSGLIRVFVYKTETPEGFTSMVVTMTPTKAPPYPATTSLGDSLAGTPYEFRYSNQDKKYGQEVVSVTEQGGATRWTVAEFNPGFDPYIQDAVYSGAGLQFTIYGVITNELKAVIKGRSVSGTDPSLYSFSYVSKTRPSSSNGQTYDFAGLGEKFSKFSKSLSDLQASTKAKADRTSGKLAESNPTENSLEDKEKKEADTASAKADDDNGFIEWLNSIAVPNVIQGTNTAGTILKFLGEVIGLFPTGSSTKNTPLTYSSYDLQLQGTLTAKKVEQTLIIRIPGTIQTDNNNATYYKCPLGLINIKKTPEADSVIYKRVYAAQYSYCCLAISRADYVSYRMRNNLEVSFNSGAGLDLVSVQAAIVGEILPDANGNASYDLYKKNVHTKDDGGYIQFDLNFTRADLEAGRLLIANFDTEKKLHSFQTPFVNIECLNGLTFNAPKETKVFLRIKAILKRRDDPTNAPILYVQDYHINAFKGTMDPVLRQNHNTVYSWQNLPPYSNLTESPTTISDVLINSITYSEPQLIKADNSITTENGADVIVPIAQAAFYRAGYSVDLQPGFEAQMGSTFEASINTYGYNITCGSPIIEAFEPNGPCYNTTASGLRTATKPNTGDQQIGSEIVTVYPTPTTGKLVITGINDSKNAVITILDQSGRTVRELRSASYEATGRIDLDVSALQNGVYFVKIQTLMQTITKKVVVSK